MKQTEDKQPRGLQRILFGVWGSGLYVSQDLEEKLLPWGKAWRANERARCKGMCGALRVWMIGEVNQVPSWPSCQSNAFPSAPLQYNYVRAYFFSSGTQSQVLLWSMHGWWVSVCPCLFFLSPCSHVRAHVWMVMNNQTLLGYLHFL